MNYEKKVMENAYEILTTVGFEWSLEFRDVMKTQLINLLLEYFTEIEEYERCTKLQTMKTNLENKNENISENVITGSKIS